MMADEAHNRNALTMVRAKVDTWLTPERSAVGNDLRRFRFATGRASTWASACRRADESR
jgi:hypothetical protein